MYKKNVFLVSGMLRGADGKLSSTLAERIICSVDHASASKFVADTMPNFEIASLTSLLQLEERAKKMAATLAGADAEWSVYIDPLLS